jgi:hypothetical protein
MKNKFFEGGGVQLRRGQKELSIESVQKKYAAELATATGDQKRRLQEKIAAEFLRQKNHKPSPQTLW